MTSSQVGQITAVSALGFDAAIEDGMSRAAKTLDHIKGVLIRNCAVEVVSGERMYRVTIVLLAD